MLCVSQTRKQLLSFNRKANTIITTIHPLCPSAMHTRGAFLSKDYSKEVVQKQSRGT